MIVVSFFNIFLCLYPATNKATLYLHCPRSRRDHLLLLNLLSELYRLKSAILIIYGHLIRINVNFPKNLREVADLDSVIL